VPQTYIGGTLKPQPVSDIQSDPESWVPLVGHGTGYISSAWQTRFAAVGLQTLDDFLQTRGEPLSKPGLGRRYRARLRLDGASVYLKRFEGDPLLARVRRWWEDGSWHSPAHHEVQVARALDADGIPAIRALAWGEQTRDRAKRSFVVLSAAPGEPADQYLRRRLTTGSGDPAPIQPLIRQFAGFAAQFHAAGWRHRDFYSCHLFVAPGGEGGMALTLIDLQRVFRPRWRTLRWRIKDLAQLNYSADEIVVPWRWRLRFFGDYCADRDRREKRRWLQAIERKTAAMQARGRGRQHVGRYSLTRG